ncbi:DUF2867 domain-containing protein [bacterium]|nr:DUF2867 domain-containing protein [bacterium]
MAMGKKFLITGSSGSIGKALVDFLKDQSEVELYCLVRDPQKLPFRGPAIHILVGDLLLPQTLPPLPQNLDAAYFFVHSMSEGSDFDLKEQQIAHNFVDWVKKSELRQVIYLSGLGREEDVLSKHLLSRRKVEEIFVQADLPYTILRAAIILASGSASFEIIRDLVEHLPVMITPKWVNNRSQPLAISDVLRYLTEVANHPECIRKIFEIGGPEVISYRDMLLRFAKFRGFRRLIIPVPFLTPKLSSYWIYFVTSTTFKLAQSLVLSLKNDTYVHDDSIKKIIPLVPKTFEEACKEAFIKTEEGHAPTFGTLSYEAKAPLNIAEPNLWYRLQYFGQSQDRFYFMNWAWKIRIAIDYLFGGKKDFFDVWDILIEDKENKHMLLYATMRMPGEAWLEFWIQDGFLRQKAVFRPSGVLGRFYWWVTYPIHLFLFPGMVKRLATRSA